MWKNFKLSRILKGLFCILVLFYFFLYDPTNPSFISTGYMSVNYLHSFVSVFFNYLIDFCFFLFGNLTYLLFVYLLLDVFFSIEYDFALMQLSLCCFMGEILFGNAFSFGIVGDWLYNFRLIFGYKHYLLYECFLLYFPLSIFFGMKAIDKKLIDFIALFNKIFKFSYILIKKAFKIRNKQVIKSSKKEYKQKTIAQNKNLSDNALPSLSLLQNISKQKAPTWNVSARQKQLEQILSEFDVKGKIVRSAVGPIITLYELQTDPGVKAMRIIGLANDIARSMSALSVRIATIPGRDVLGIEVSNPSREMVYLKEILSSEKYLSTKGLCLGLGCDIGGNPVTATLANMPHMLMAGTTGSGKSVVIHTILLSLLFKHSPKTCKLILIDPKMLELSSYADIPHLLMPVVTDSKLALVALKWAVQEMERRYKIMAAAGVRNLDAYNEKHEDHIPYIVVIVDEFADLMLVAGKDIDNAIQRLAQMARAAGIHVILATQRPSVDVITGIIKANFPTRLALQVATKIDARTVLGDYGGAEQLLGKGDMLFLYGGKLERIHGPYVSEEEVEAVVNFWKQQGQPKYEEIDLMEFEEDGSGLSGSDEMLDKVWDFLRNTGRVSASSVQREFNIGFNRASKYLEILEKQRKVSPPDNMGRRKLI